MENSCSEKLLVFEPITEGAGIVCFACVFLLCFLPFSLHVSSAFWLEGSSRRKVYK